MVMEINHRKEENKGAFVATENEVKAGEMTYSKAGEEKIIIDHTEVHPEFNGKGVGKQMVFAAVEYARENGIKILPLCPFAKAMFDKNKDIRDVLV